MSEGVRSRTACDDTVCGHRACYLAPEQVAARYDEDIIEPPYMLSHYSQNGCAVPFRECRKPDHWANGLMPDVASSQTEQS